MFMASVSVLSAYAVAQKLFRELDFYHTGPGGTGGLDAANGANS